MREEGERSIAVPLFFSNFWVQIHKLPDGSMSEGMARQLGNFIGQFLEYDAKILTKGFQKIMRIRVCIDVRSPLKIKK